MRCGVDDGKEKHSVSKLSMHPDILIKWDESNLRPDEPHDRSADWQQDEHGIYTQY